MAESHQACHCTVKRSHSTKEPKEACRLLGINLLTDSGRVNSDTILNLNELVFT